MSQNYDAIFYDRIYSHFQKICTFRRPSGEEKEISDFILKSAAELNLPAKRDSHNNVVVYKEGSNGLNNLPPLLFQGHLDMICVPDKNIFPIRPQIKDGWVYTDGTTLGADNGIAVSLMLELMHSSFEKNPPLELLFTTSEEIGLIGASSIETDVIEIHSSKLINLDSEEIQKITVGCAGGQDFDIRMNLEREKNRFQTAYRIKVTGPGGHSGLKIHEKIPNAIKCAVQIIDLVSAQYSIAIAEISGGIARNAIPADAQVVICVDRDIEGEIKSAVAKIKEENSTLEIIQTNITSESMPDSVFSQRSANDIMKIVQAVPHGVIKMNTESGGVLSSVNLAVISTEENGILITMNGRSSDDRELSSIIEDISHTCDSIAGTKLIVGDNYVGWKPDMDSELLKDMTDVYRKIRGTKPDYLDIHAGLECGILMNKVPSIKEAVSIGPEIRNAHSVEERLEISSTIQIWEIILSFIEKYSID